MLGNWHKFSALWALLLGLSVSACQSNTPIRQLDFQVDGGQVQSFPMTERGALPASDGVYHVENLGLMLYQADDGSIQYAWNFVINAAQKTATRIQVSQVLNDGRLQALIVDDVVSDQRDGAWRNLENGGRSQWLAGRWHAVSVGQNVAHSTWLKEAHVESMFVFKIQIDAQDGSRSILYQPMVLAPNTKQQYLKSIKDIQS